MKIGDTEAPATETKVFISYSRKDRERAQQITETLRARSFDVFKDTDDILPTEEWRGRLEQLIEEADTIVFLLSPNSVTSEVCAWEVDYATSLNKRIAPIVIEEVDTAQIPPLLARLNFIFCTPRDRFEDAASTLVSALNYDIVWIREHTRLAGLAKRWESADRPARLLLRGQDIADAESWRDAHPREAPQVTEAQARFISESRAGASRRQRGWIAGSLTVTLGAIGLAAFAYFQSVEANRQRGLAEDFAADAQRQQAIAEDNAAEAERQRRTAEQNAEEAQRQRDAALETQSLFLADLAQQRLAADEPEDALALALEALPQDLDQPERPLVSDAVRALSAAHRAIDTELFLESEKHVDTLIAHPEEPVLFVLYNFFTPSTEDSGSPGPQKLIVEARAMEDASLLWRYEEDDLSVAAGGVANNGERLVIAGSSGDLLSLDTGTGQVISRRKFADGNPAQLTVDPVSGAVAVKGDGSAEVLRDADWSETTIVPLPGGKVAPFGAPLALAPSGATLIVAYSDGLFQRLSVDDGAVLSERRIDIGRRYYQPVIALRDGRLLVSSSFRDWVLDAQSFEVIHKVEHDYSVDNRRAWSLDGDLIALQMSDERIDVLRASTGEVVRSYRGHDEGVYGRIAMDHLSGRVFSAESAEDGEPMRVVSWPVKRANLEKTEIRMDSPPANMLQAPDRSVSVFWPNGQTRSILLRFADGEERRLDLPSPVEFHELAAFDAFGELLTMFDRDGAANIWFLDMFEQGYSEPLKIPGFDPNGLAGVAIVNEKTGPVIWVLDGSVRRIGIVDEVVPYGRSRRDYAWGMAYHEGAKRIAVIGDAGLALYDAETGEELTRIEIEGEFGRVAFADQGRKLILARDTPLEDNAEDLPDHWIAVYDLASGERIARHMIADKQQTLGILTSADGRYALARTGGPPVLIDGRTGERIADLVGHNDMVMAGDFSDDSEYLATVASDLEDVMVWRTKDGLPVDRFRADTDNGVYFWAPAFAADGRSINVLNGDEGSLHNLPFFGDLDQMLASARSRVERISPLSTRDRCAFFLETGPDCPTLYFR